MSTTNGADQPANGRPKTTPGPQGAWLLGSLFQLGRMGVLDFYLEGWRTYGDVSRYRLGPMTAIQFVRPEHIRTLLVEKRDNYVKGLSHDKLRLSLGTGILTAEGETWRERRRLMSPTFTAQAVNRFAGVMSDVTADLLDAWYPEAAASRPVVINREMTQLAMSVISRSMFAADISQGYATAGRALLEILEAAARRSMSLIDLPLWLPTPANRRLTRALREIDDLLYGIIRQRRSQPPGDDLLSALLTTGELDERALRDEALIIFFAGHETTAQTLTWTWIMLAQHPEVEARFHAELDGVLHGRSPRVKDLEALPYTQMIVDEVLRLYSPVAMIARDAVADDEVDGHPVPANAIVTITPYITHRHPDFWERPGAFWPDHFTPERVAERERYAYLPFGAGHRICLGKHFALLEAMMVLAELGQRFRLRLEPGPPIGVKWAGTLRPDRDVRVKLHAR